VVCCSALMPALDFLLLPWIPSRSTLFPYTTLFRSRKILPVRYPLMKWLTLQSRQQSVLMACCLRHILLVNVGMEIFVVHLLALRSEEHTSELQSRFDLVCRLLLEKKNHSVSALNTK